MTDRHLEDITAATRKVQNASNYSTRSGEFLRSKLV